MVWRLKSSTCTVLYYMYSRQLRKSLPNVYLLYKTPRHYLIATMFRWQTKVGMRGVLLPSRGWSVNNYFVQGNVFKKNSHHPSHLFPLDMYTSALILKREVNFIYSYMQKKSIKNSCLTTKRKKLTFISDLEVKCIYSILTWKNWLILWCRAWHVCHPRIWRNTWNGIYTSPPPKD
jgi:hypothetical protein